MPRRSTNDHWSEYDDTASGPAYDPTSASTGGASLDDYLEPDDSRQHRRRQQRSNAQMWMIIGGVGVVGVWLIGLFATMKPPTIPPPPQVEVPLERPSPPPTPPGPRISPGPVPSIPKLDKPESLTLERRNQLMQGVVGIVASAAKTPQNKGRGSQSTGSGFLVDARGYVVTNAHVIQGKQPKIEVFTHDGNAYKAQIVKQNPDLDIALLRLQTSTTFRPLALGDSSRVQVEEKIYVLGYPRGTSPSDWQADLTEGRVRSLQAPKQQSWVQTDARADQGNTGGPMMRADTGEVIGIITFKTGGTETMATARPINKVRDWLVRHIR